MKHRKVCIFKLCGKARLDFIHKNAAVTFNILVTVARAVELKHKPTVITAVALGTSNLFQKAGKLKYKEIVILFINLCINILA